MRDVEEVGADVPVEEEEDRVGVEQRQREEQPDGGARNAKQKSGMRLNDIPGARDLKIVTMNWPAVSVDAMPLKMIPRQ